MLSSCIFKKCCFHLKCNFTKFQRKCSPTKVLKCEWKKTSFVVCVSASNVEWVWKTFLSLGNANMQENVFYIEFCVFLWFYCCNQPHTQMWSINFGSPVDEIIFIFVNIFKILSILPMFSWEHFSPCRKEIQSIVRGNEKFHWYPWINFIWWRAPRTQPFTSVKLLLNLIEFPIHNDYHSSLGFFFYF